MKSFSVILSAAVLSLNAVAQLPGDPAKLYGKLFHDVQMAPLFPDQKTFADAVPKKSPGEIIADYQKATSNPAIRFALDLFVKANFDLPADPQINYIRQETDVTAHIRNCWPLMKREPEKAVEGGSLLPLPYAYIVGGGRSRELDYGTAYFAMLGLKESGQADMIENMVKDFAAQVDSFGYIPAGNRSYVSGRSQAPYFSMMVELLAGLKGDNIYTGFLPQLEREYAYWMEGAATCKSGQAMKRVVKLKDGSLLNRYWDDNTTPRPEQYRYDVEAAQKTAGKALLYQQLRAAAAGGWEASARWRAVEKNPASARAFSVIPIDLNCLLYKLEQVIARGRLLMGQDSLAGVYRKKAERRAYAIDKYCWNKQLNFYTDYLFTAQKQLNLITPAGLYPFCVYENKPDYMSLLARRAATVVRQKLLKSGGLQNTDHETGQGDDAPYGIASLQWMAVYGLDRCGQKELAREIAQAWIKLNVDVYKRTGKLLARYNVADSNAEANKGEGISNYGFSYTNGVLLQLSAIYGISK
ncbi:MAG: alpha,alpha-trehalase [Bacteroidetes bacterium]|nr:alpha,alpha-trehalase [Bacteroidota bacterium]